MQVSTVERYHLMPVQTAVSKKIGQQQTVRVQRGAAHRDSILQPLWKTVPGLFRRLELELLYHPAVSLRENKISILERELPTHIHSNIPHNNQDGETNHRRLLSADG